MRIRVLFRNVCSIVVSATIASCVLLNLVHAEVVTDGSVGTRLSVQGSEFVIPQSLGSTVGTNLFHSFQSFNIANTQSATFTGANSISNVISRVTGGQSSTINGTLRSEIGQANFFFLNPSGVIFGPNAAVNVPAAFHVSTAANLQFSDGAVFSAIDSAASTLSMASPDAFGFVTNHSAAINIEQGQLAFAPDSVTSLSAGEIVIESGSLINIGGEIRITATGALDTLVPIDSAPIEHGNATGNILVNGSRIDASGNGAGQIAISGGDTEIIGSNLFVANLGSEVPDANAGIVLHANTLLVDNTSIASAAGATGNAGSINVLVNKGLTIVNGGTISSSTFSQGNAGSIAIQAANLRIDGQNSALTTGLFSNTGTGSSGQAGNIDVSVNNTLDIVNDAAITSNTASETNAGSITIQATDLNIDGKDSAFDTGISSLATREASGNAGNIDVSVMESLNLINGGVILNSTVSEGNAGSVTIQTRNFSINGQNSKALTGITSSPGIAASGSAGNIKVSVTETLDIKNGGIINSSTFSKTDAGSIIIRATDLNVSDAVILSGAASDSSGNAGNIDISTVKTVNIVNGGQINTSTSSLGRAGLITLKTTDLGIDGQGSTFFTGILNRALPDSKGNAGNIDVSVTGTVNIVDAGGISSDTSSNGNAGLISIQATNFNIDGQGNPSVTGIASDARTGSTGTAGNINVSVTEALKLVNGGGISSDTLSEGRAGSITIQATDLSINGKNTQLFTGISSAAEADSTGNAGNIDVSITETLHLFNGGEINSNTLSQGRAGLITVRAKNFTIDDQGSGFFTTGIFSVAEPKSTGDSGNIKVSVTDTLRLVSGGQINNSTFAEGNAGSITVQATELDINGQDRGAGLFSVAGPDSIGDAGNIDVSVTKTLSIDRGGKISSSTFSDGNAGSIAVKTTQLDIDGQASEISTGILSQALTDSSGQAGNISVNSNRLTIANGGTISIQSDPFVNAVALSQIQPTEINIQARNITLLNGKEIITAQSAGNVPASNIIINTSQQLNAKDAQISTAANQANGGNIAISGGNLFLNNSQVTTSVVGVGNGGDIKLNPNVLVLNTGFVQANTAGANATGGNIIIDSEAMISSNNQLATGGNTPVAFQPSFNVIQAAAPDGVSGNIAITSPELNISGTLASLDAQLIDIGSLSKNPCANPTLKQSILTSISKGGLPTSVEQSLSVPLNSLRLQNMLDQSVPDQLNTISPQARNSFADTPCL